MESVWTLNDRIREFPRLDGDADADVLIIGGGMAGVLCAYALRENGVHCLLVEGGRLGGGITGNTTAKITAQHGMIYSKLAAKYGLRYARKYYLANLRALDTYRAMCRNIDCDFEEKDSFVYTCTDPKLAEDEAEICRKIGCEDAEVVSSLDIPVGLAAVRMKNQAQFDPLKFLNAVSEDLNVREHTFVRRVDGNTAYTNAGRITAGKIVFATHFPFVNTRGAYPLKLYQHRSYVIALENAPDVGGMFVDDCHTGMSFRNYDGLLLLGGGGGRTGAPSGGFDELKRFAAEHYPQARLRYRWAAQDCMSLDGAPYIGHYSAHTPDWYVATGFNKWGMTSSMVAAQLITDLILGRKNPYAKVFSPSRSILTKQLFINAGTSAANLLSPGGKRCSHLGCKLKWNPHEHSWDCPCHGSRFGEYGRLINNPAKHDIEINK